MQHIDKDNLEKFN